MGSAVSSSLSPLPSPQHTVSVSVPAERTPLWVCIHFSDLPLEVLGLESSVPGVVAGAAANDQIVYAATAAARAVGIEPGMPIGAARARATVLQVCPRDATAESLLLQNLAEWCGRFTPGVSLEPPDAILLEVRASLRLWGGCELLVRQLRCGLAHLGHRACVAVAPTPQAGLLLARSGRDEFVFQREALRSALGDLSIACLGSDKNLLRRLARSGVRTLHDLWRLPRDGLSRRFGAELTAYLDRVLGLRPDPRASHSPADRFAARVELEAEIDDVALVLAAVRPRLEEFTAFLLHRAATTTAMSLVLHHRGRRATRLSIGSRLGTRDSADLAYLLRERLRWYRLPAPVIRIDICSSAIQPHPGTEVPLFDRDQAQQDWPGQLDALAARLGRRAMGWLRAVPDHRPEHAWRDRESSGGRRGGPTPRQRPCWLLPIPQPLPWRGRVLWHGGRLDIAAGPERIEGGWWDERDQCRDYYIAIAPDGRRLWIFQDLKEARWYLHGLFG